MCCVTLNVDKESLDKSLISIKKKVLRVDINFLWNIHRDTSHAQTPLYLIQHFLVVVALIHVNTTKRDRHFRPYNHEMKNNVIVKSNLLWDRLSQSRKHYCHPAILKINFNHFIAFKASKDKQ